MSTEGNVTMTCMTTKQKFEVQNPTVVVLSNGRYAYKEKCPWTGKNDKELYAFKFCSAAAYEGYLQRTGDTAAGEDASAGVFQDDGSRDSESN